MYKDLVQIAGMPKIMLFYISNCVFVRVRFVIICTWFWFLWNVVLRHISRNLSLYTNALVADIPGLVKDAHLNKGLGFSFLRHVERCSSLLYVIDISDDDFLDRYLILRNELRLYKPALLDLPTIIVANKMDLIENHNERVQSLEFQTRAQVVAISGKNLTNTENLKTIIRRLVSSVKQS